MIWILIIGFFISAFIGWRFFFLRNPNRKIPSDPSAVVAPADGTILYVKQIKNKPVSSTKGRVKIPLQPEASSGTLIGIHMHISSVHRNRAPIAGLIASLVHLGTSRNRSMLVIAASVALGMRAHEKDLALINDNERLITEIQTPRGSVLVMQIAGLGTDRIVSFVEEGQQVQQGDQIGMIRFGSQCDLFLPDALGFECVVPVGSYIYAGETILGHVKM